MSTRLVAITFALALVATGAGLAMVVGAQDGGSATQAGTVEITTDAAIDIEPADTHNGDSYALLDQNDELALDFEHLNEEARTRADRVFTVTAQGVDPINVSAGNETATGVSLYRADDPGTPMSEPVQLQPGESVDVGVEVDTTGEYGSGTIWINATAPEDEEGAAGPGGPGGPGPGDGDDGASDVAVVDADVAPTELAPGESATATATLVNDGTVAGTRTVTLAIDGVVVDQREVTVPPGEEVTVSFERTFQQTGTFEVAVGGLDAGTVTVTAPPGEEPEGAVFSVANASLSPATIAPGDATTVTATVTNEGDHPGFFYAELAVGDVVLEEQAVQVEPGESEQVAFERTFQQRGGYDVAVSGADAGTLRVEGATGSTMRRYGSEFALLLGAVSVPTLGGGFVAARRRRQRRRLEEPNQM